MRWGKQSVFIEYEGLGLGLALVALRAEESPCPGHLEPCYVGIGVCLVGFPLVVVTGLKMD